MVLKVQGRTDNAPEEMKDDAATVEHVEQPVEEAGASARRNRRYRQHRRGGGR